MTQVFAGDDQVADRGMLTHGVSIPMQPAGLAPGGPPPGGTSTGRPPSLSTGPVLSPSVMPGKGVRRIRCVGCAQETLPRNDDGAPLCQRCSELLAAAGADPLAIPVVFRTPRWLRRRSALG